MVSGRVRTSTRGSADLFGTAQSEVVVPDQDRRVRRTRKLLQDALVALVAERGYERVTVQDVLDRADVGRSTFYAHFTDKDALFASCFDDLREALRRHLAEMPAGPPTDPLGSVFEHAYRNREVYRAACGRRGENVLSRQLHPLLVELLTEHLSTVGTRMPVPVMAEYHASALTGLVVWWVREDFPYGPEHMAGMCRDLTVPGVIASLGVEH
jgi:AcrR family transcriptional regulator